MPLYHFAVVRNGRAVAPADGLELADMKAAWDEATTAFGQMVRDIDGSLELDAIWSIEVQDENRKKLRVISLTASEV